MEKKLEKNWVNYFTSPKTRVGGKTPEQTLKKRDVEIYQMVVDFAETNGLRHLPFRRQIYHFMHTLPAIPSCKTCGKELEFGRSLDEGYRTYCSPECMNKCPEHIKKCLASMDYESNFKKIKKTMKEKYGYENLFKNADFIQQKTIEKYGVYNVNKLDSVQKKREQTNIERYGTKTYVANKEYRRQRNKILLDDLRNRYPEFVFIELDKNTYTINCSVCSRDYSIYYNTFQYRATRNVNPCIHCNPLNKCG